MTIRQGLFFVSLFFVCFGNTFAADVDWVPNANGDWSVATNWTSDPALPSAIDDLSINVGGSAIRTITYASGTNTIASLDLSEELRVIGGSLAVSGTTELRAQSSLITNGGTIAFGGAVTADGAEFRAFNGSVLSVPITTYDQAGTNVIFQVTDPGSQLDLSSLNTITASTTGFRNLDVVASNGGLADLSSVTNIINSTNFVTVSFSSTGIDSQLNLSAYNDYTSGAINNITVGSGGTMLWSNPTALNRTHAVIGDSTLTTSQITSFTNGRLQAIEGANPDFSNLSNADGSSLIVGALFETGTLQLPSLTSFQSPGGSDIEFSSTGNTSPA